MFRILTLVLALFPSLAFAQVPMTGAGVGSPVVGPPTLTALSHGLSSGSQPGPFTFTLTAGTTFSSRWIYALINFNHASESSITTCTIGGVTCAVNSYFTTGGTPRCAILAANVPTGTSPVVSVTFNANAGSFPIIQSWQTDSTTLISTTPTNNATTSGSGVSTWTSSVATSAGGAMMMNSSGFGGSPSSYSISASDSGMTSDGAFGVTLGGHSNNVAASAANNVTLSWTGTTTETICLSTIR